MTDQLMCHVVDVLLIVDLVYAFVVDIYVVQKLPSFKLVVVQCACVCADVVILYSARLL